MKTPPVLENGAAACKQYPASRPQDQRTAHRSYPCDISLTPGALILKFLGSGTNYCKAQFVTMDFLYRTSVTLVKIFQPADAVPSRTRRFPCLLGLTQRPVDNEILEVGDINIGLIHLHATAYGNACLMHRIRIP